MLSANKGIFCQDEKDKNDVGWSQLGLASIRLIPFILFNSSDAPPASVPVPQGGSPSQPGLGLMRRGFDGFGTVDSFPVAGHPRESGAPAEPLTGGDVVWQQQLGRSLALPTGASRESRRYRVPEPKYPFSPKPERFIRPPRPSPHSRAFTASEITSGREGAASVLAYEGDAQTLPRELAATPTESPEEPEN